MGGVIYESCLLKVGVMHPLQHVVHRSLYSLKFGISQRQLRRILRRYMFDGVLYGVIFGIIKGQLGQLVCLQRDLVYRLQSIFYFFVLKIV